MVVRISGTTGITFGVETFATESYVDGEIGAIPVKEKKIAAFTANGTWTVPAGVTYAIAHMLGGGGGSGRNSGSNGSASSVAFASGIVSSNGGIASQIDSEASNFTVNAIAGNANTGQGSTIRGSGGQSSRPSGMSGPGNSNWILAGADVTPAETIAVTVGAGGAAGTSGAAGGSGYVYIEYYE